MEKSSSRIGYIHSYESLGLVDGPGIRFVIFFQGCNLRCRFCHNPDTWEKNKGTAVTADELFKKIERYKPYFERSDGGVTFSGGEPLLQYDFLVEILKKCKEAGIHTAIDTSGVGPNDCFEALSLADLVLLDIKQVESKAYKSMTGLEMTAFNRFLAQLKETAPKVWIRAVIVPGINDNFEYIKQIWNIAKTIPTLQRIELLPYHILGEEKYKKLKIDYSLSGTPPMDKNKTKLWQDALNNLLHINKLGPSVK